MTSIEQAVPVATLPFLMSSSVASWLLVAASIVVPKYLVVCSSLYRMAFVEERIMLGFSDPSRSPAYHDLRLLSVDC